MSNYSPDVLAAMDRDTRNMVLAGAPLSGILDNLQTLVTSGNLGILSNASDVDSLAFGGGACARDLGTAPGTSLLFAWKSGRFYNGLSVTPIAAGSLTLAASATSYVEADRTGTVTSNTTGFTSGKLPLYIVTAGPGSYAATGVVSAKALLTLLGLNSVNGAMLSVPGQTKEIAAQIGAVSAAAAFLIPCPNAAAVVSAAALANSVAVAQSDANFWTLSLVNLGPTGTGTQAIAATGPVNTTKLTGGSAMAAGIVRPLSLAGTTLATAAGDVLQLTLTPTGAPVALAQTVVRADFTFAS